MHRARHVAAILMILASQLVGSVVVICHEGDGRQRVEVMSEACCAPETDTSASVPGRESADRFAPDPCGTCFDAVVEQAFPSAEGLDLEDHFAASAQVVLPGEVSDASSPVSRWMEPEATLPCDCWPAVSRGIVLLI